MLVPESRCSKYVDALLASAVDTLSINLKEASLIGIHNNRCKPEGHDDSDDDGDSDGLHGRKGESAL